LETYLKLSAEFNTFEKIRPCPVKPVNNEKTPDITIADYYDWL
jgi:hypothetical protein